MSTPKSPITPLEALENRKNKIGHLAEQAYLEHALKGIVGFLKGEPANIEEKKAFLKSQRGALEKMPDFQIQSRFEVALIRVESMIEAFLEAVNTNRLDLHGIVEELEHRAKKEIENAVTQGMPQAERDDPKVKHNAMQLAGESVLLEQIMGIAEDIRTGTRKAADIHPAHAAFVNATYQSLVKFTGTGVGAGAGR